mmetsp:Transcript_13467/g.28060  ORF Transcript_13467/g.28060 Transcript_13467/m.28060 type:complete len:345 (+) Transcript_13467:36-1070(+)
MVIQMVAHGLLQAMSWLLNVSRPLLSFSNAAVFTIAVRIVRVVIQASDVSQESVVHVSMPKWHVMPIVHGHCESLLCNTVVPHGRQIEHFAGLDTNLDGQSTAKLHKVRELREILLFRNVKRDPWHCFSTAKLSPCIPHGLRLRRGIQHWFKKPFWRGVLSFERRWWTMPLMQEGHSSRRQQREDLFTAHDGVQVFVMILVAGRDCALVTNPKVHGFWLIAKSADAKRHCVWNVFDQSGQLVAERVILTREVWHAEALCSIPLRQPIPKFAERHPLLARLHEASAAIYRVPSAIGRGIDGHLHITHRVEQVCVVTPELQAWPVLFAQACEHKGLRSSDKVPNKL